MVEFRCGYGTFTLPAARLVDSRVYAFDIEPDLVAGTARRATEAGLVNVHAERRDRRPDDGAGYAVLFNILHIENPVGLLAEAHRVLTPDGMVGMIH